MDRPESVEPDRPSAAGFLKEVGTKTTPKLEPRAIIVTDRFCTGGQGAEGDLSEITELFDEKHYYGPLLNAGTEYVSRQSDLCTMSPMRSARCKNPSCVQGSPTSTGESRS